MTRRETDRYIRKGGPVPQIYPGTLDGLNSALGDCVSISRFMPDALIQLTAIRGRDRIPIRIFHAGHCEWQPDTESILERKIP